MGATEFEPISACPESIAYQSRSKLVHSAVREIPDSIFAPLNFHVIRIRKIPARRNYEWV